MKIRSISHACGDMPVKLGLELFDKLVMPILLYGSEVWGCEIRDRIEAVQRKYCRTPTWCELSNSKMTLSWQSAVDFHYIPYI